MQQRFAFAILVRLTKDATPGGNEAETLYGTVQAADAPEAVHFTSLRQLSKWIEAVLPLHASPQVTPIAREPHK
jgi:hypothetical protein